MRRERGSIMLETALYLPVLFLLLFGMVELAKITYTYYAIQKILYTVARYLTVQQGVNLCDATDTIVQAAKNIALTGSTDASSPSFIPSLTADMIQVRVERFSSLTADLAECDCAATGCDTANGGQSPDFIVVSIPDGYPFRLAIPQLAVESIVLRPHVRVPFQGT